MALQRQFCVPPTTQLKTQKNLLTRDKFDSELPCTLLNHTTKLYHSYDKYDVLLRCGSRGVRNGDGGNGGVPPSKYNAPRLLRVLSPSGFHTFIWIILPPYSSG